MTEQKRLSAVQHISDWSLRGTEKRPSELFRVFEADLIGRLAHDTALAGLRFDGWPTVRLLSEEGSMLRGPGYYRLVAEVMTK